MSEYNPHIPAHCLPFYGIPGVKKVFRAGGDSPTPDNRATKSHFERGMAHDLSDCRVYGLSVWLDADGVRHAQHILKKFLKNKTIFEAVINDNDGCVKPTPTGNQPNHYTLWVKNRCDIVPKLSVHQQLTLEGRKL